MLKTVDALSNSGKEPGLEIFVIREIKPPCKGIAAVKIAAEQNYEIEYEAIRIPGGQYGTFYSGELYLVIKTTDKRIPSPQIELHVWFGKDYAEIPPKWINNFDRLHFDWDAIIHFEIQDNECDIFENYFKDLQPMIRYMDGRYPDVAISAMSRFYKVIRNERGNHRVKNIPFNLSLMNQEDCFILDTSYNTRAYISNGATKCDRKRIIAAAKFIRENDHDGEIKEVDVVDLMTLPDNGNRESCKQASEFLKNTSLDDDEDEVVTNDERPENVVMHSLTKTSILHRENPAEYPPRFAYTPSEEKDEQKKVVTLSSKIKFIFRYGLFYLLGKKQVRPQTKDNPREENFVKTAMKRVLLREYLETKRLYILEETVRRGVYIWVGKDCDKKLQEEVTNWVHYELRKELKGDQKKPSRWSHAIKFPEGREPMKFRQYFKDWNCEQTSL
ncbi:gelsolin-like [Hyposmocoma kahamanoa]|uniref:gelsolin-like n=1 Tax=Hyposmocoma kahamanoa TaxID=1477025 RepID=UPI000E6D8684|nr:gelsolin-like [Hyposmocoma kahamanoa]